MGTGIGKNCERCGNQLNYDDCFKLKEDGYEHNLCDECYSIVEFDKKNKKMLNNMKPLRLILPITLSGVLDIKI